jgi:hypothetical protein
MAPHNPTLLEYARYYNIAEDSDPFDYVDETCAPDPPAPPIQGLAVENPEERMGELDYRFCSNILYAKLPTDPKDMGLLSTCLHTDVQDKNIWRGILPEVVTTEDVPEPVLHSADVERLLAGYPPADVDQQDPSSSFHDFFDTAVPGAPATPSESVVSQFTFESEVSSSPQTIGVVVESGPDVPNVPEAVRNVFEMYNSDQLSQQTGVNLTASGNVASASQGVNTAAVYGGETGNSYPQPGTQELPFISIESDSLFSLPHEEIEDGAEGEIDYDEGDMESEVRIRTV